jgi:hypothetical protein
VNSIDKHNLSFAKHIANSAAIGNSSPINATQSRFVFSVQVAIEGDSLTKFKQQ